ncbi:MAG: rRNA maturation RNase YbeY [Treponema sp.]|jgi:probable rRNA maturation factor|nr:rRNA maturation RNase YbeY [Treponema sp.]
MNQASIDVSGIEIPPWLNSANSFILKVLDILERDNWDLSVVFCNNEFIRRLNAGYRGKDEATDVLSFPLGTVLEKKDGIESRYLPGDIVISLETLRENVEYFQVPEDEELRRLLIHGILHLDGMDHTTNDEKEPMLQLQERLLDCLAGERILP